MQSQRSGKFARRGPCREKLEESTERINQENYGLWPVRLRALRRSLIAQNGTNGGGGNAFLAEMTNRARALHLCAREGARNTSMHVTDLGQLKCCKNDDLLAQRGAHESQ
jgi:hypothetical protein